MFGRGKNKIDWSDPKRELPPPPPFPPGAQQRVQAMKAFEDRWGKEIRNTITSFAKEVLDLHSNEARQWNGKCHVVDNDEACAVRYYLPSKKVWSSSEDVLESGGISLNLRRLDFYTYHYFVLTIYVCSTGQKFCSGETYWNLAGGVRNSGDVDDQRSLDKLLSIVSQRFDCQIVPNDRFALGRQLHFGAMRKGKLQAALM